MTVPSTEIRQRASTGSSPLKTGATNVLIAEEESGMPQGQVPALPFRVQWLHPYCDAEPRPLPHPTKPRDFPRFRGANVGEAASATTSRQQN